MFRTTPPTPFYGEPLLASGRSVEKEKHSSAVETQWLSKVGNPGNLDIKESVCQAENIKLSGG